MLRLPLRERGKTPIALFLALCCLLWLAADAQSSPFFRDVTVAAGILETNFKRTKYGGPCVADLDSDGYPDLLFVHHDSYYAEIYFNHGNGSFVRHPFRLWTDMHGIVAVPQSVYGRNRRFTVSSGGNFGKNPKLPQMFKVFANNRNIVESTFNAGLTKVGGRGRTAIFMHMKKNGDHRNLDVIFTNARDTSGKRPNWFGYVGRGAAFRRRQIQGLQKNTMWFGTTTDIDNDGIMEVITYQEFGVHKLVAPFKFEDITSAVLPLGGLYRGVVAVAELDYDNDGDMDLYLARTNTGDLGWLPKVAYPDILLENRGGKYFDVSKRAGALRTSTARGVTAGDFNNDGWMDIYVTQHRSADAMLLNRGDGTFKKVVGLVNRPGSVAADHAVAVDYDLDGRLDLIVAQGDQLVRSLGGSYRVLNNVQPRYPGAQWLLVRVGAAPNRSATSLHAVVTVRSGGLTMTRRVGSPGDAASKSLIETVHFGLAKHIKVNVKVKWTNGVSVIRYGVRSGQQITVGLV